MSAMIPSSQRSVRLYRALIVVFVASVVIGSVSPPAQAYPRPGETRLVSVTRNGTQGDNSSHHGLDSNGDMTPDGRYITFTSGASNLVQPDRNLVQDVFWKDMKTGRIEMPSKGPVGLPLGGLCPDITNANVPLKLGSFDSAISTNGRFVAFTSCATDLVPGDTNIDGDIFVWDRNSDRIERVSVASDGKQANGSSIRPAMSASGRYVAFSSLATNLVANDDNEQPDVFVHDRQKNKTTRVSVTSQGRETRNERCDASDQPPVCETFKPTPSLSANGRYVAFDSIATNMVETDLNRVIDVFVHDRNTRRTQLVSVTSDGTQADKSSILSGIQHALSANGKLVVYISVANNLVPNASAVPGLIRNHDVYLFDRTSRRTTRLSVSPSGAEGERSAGGFASISPDGRFVLFDGASRYDMPGQQIAARDSHRVDVWVHDTRTGGLMQASRPLKGVESPGAEVACDGNALATTISARGRYVLFSSCNDDLVPRDRNRTNDMFRRDMGLELHAALGTSRAQTPSVQGEPGFGRQRAISATDAVEDLPPALSRLGADLLESTVAYRPTFGDLFVKMGVTQMPSLVTSSVGATPRMTYGFGFSGDGVEYEVRATPSIAAGGSGGFGTFELFRCGSECTFVGRLKGGLGTTGAEVVVSVPLAMVGLHDGGEMSELTAYTALATPSLSSVPSAVVDELSFEGTART